LGGAAMHDLVIENALPIDGAAPGRLLREFGA
jgi:hypothetical protein